MPIYSYVCKDCGEKFDLFIRIGGKDEKLICKKCGSKNIQKTFSSFSLGSSSSKIVNLIVLVPPGPASLTNFRKM